MKSKLQEWIDAQDQNDGKRWRGPFGEQIAFVRDRLVPLVGAGLADDDAYDRIASVLATHRSKSIDLPVYDLARPDLGLRLVLRDNFYDWKLSVLSERPIETDFSGLLHTTPPLEPEYTGDPLHAVYFQGFPRDLVFGYYSLSDRRRWSASIGNDAPLWTTIFLILRSLDAIKPFVWLTKESHLRLMREKDARRALPDTES